MCQRSGRNPKENVIKKQIKLKGLSDTQKKKKGGGQERKRGDSGKKQCEKQKKLTKEKNTHVKWKENPPVNMKVKEPSQGEGGAA